MKYFFTILLLFVCFVAKTQLIDDFSDMDFSSNPTWSGTTSDFIVNASGEVQLNALTGGTAYLSTPHNLSDLGNKEWDYWTKISTSPSGGNFARIYLTADNADLSTNPDGFYLQLGEALSTDAVRLMKQDGGITTQICASSDGTIANSFTIGIRVVRDNSGNWDLYVDFAGGTNYSLVSSGLDATNLVGTHTGYTCTFTAGNATKYYFDNVYVGDEILDTTPPSVVSVTAINGDLIDVLFSEAVDPVTAEDVNNYDIQPFQSATSATLDGSNPALVHIVPASTLINGNTYNMITQNIEDLVGNASVEEQNQFGFYIAEVPAKGDVIINEFMCDQSPVVGLPEVEFVEIYNRSTKVFNLQNWQLGDSSSFGTIGSNVWLLPGEYKILCATGSIVDYPNGVGVTSFPSLNNSGDEIILQSDLGVILDQIEYTSAWYQDANKDDGGYTIERINSNLPCSSSQNWSASNNPNGGTPGMINSIDNPQPDTQNPSIVETVAITASGIQIQFSEGMDSTSLVNATLNTSPSLTEQNRVVLGEFPEMMTVNFIESFQTSQTYSYTLSQVGDCSMNLATLSGSFALADNPVVGDVIINEIMFNPLTGGSDWIELYNTSDKLLNLKNWSFANYDDDTISNQKVITTNYLLQPYDYVVVGKDSTHVLQNYSAAIPGKFLYLILPSYNNDSSTIYLSAPIPLSDGLMDKVSYSDEWHFRLLDDDKGKSLERLNPEGNSQDPGNWHTAAEAIGFATPGQENSQYYPAISSGQVSFTSETISPDNDGFEDVLQINYEVDEIGLLATITIYDDRGRKIKTLTSSELLGQRGTLVWDGVDDNGAKASIGTYVLVFEAFKVDGGAAFFAKKPFVVAGKL